MRVCQVIDRLRGGGQERVAVEFARGLAGSIDCSAILATREGGDYERLLEGRDVRVFIAGRKGKWDIPAWKRVSRWLADIRPDIVHTHSPGSLFNMVLLRALTGLEYRIVAHQQMLPARGTLWRKEAIVIHRLTRYAVSRTIVTNEGLRNLLVEVCKIPPNTIDVMFNPADFDEQIQRKRPWDDPPVVCMVAQWRRQKDHLTAIRAAGILKAAGVRARWLLIGEEDRALTEEGRRLISELGLNDDVVIAGRRTDVKDLLASAAVGVLATHFEGLPVAVMEYCAAALPCVVSCVEGTDFLISPDNGIVGVPPRDPAALANAIEYILTDRERAEDLGRRAFAYMRLKANRPEVLAQLRNIYEQVLANPN